MSGIIHLMKSHPAVGTLFVIVGSGVAGSLVYLARLGMNEEVIWNKARDPFPWRRISQLQNRKFVAIAQKFGDKPDDHRNLFATDKK